MNARRLLFITGAGISADSGLPTYRGVSGLYENDSTEEGVSIEEALSGQMLKINPGLTWKYLLQIASACYGKQPNISHEVIAGLQEKWDVCVITQNIDGFHTRAGSNNVIEMHGNMSRLLCVQCDSYEAVDDPALIEVPPQCNSCAGPLRPDVVLFGEMLQEKALARYYKELSRGFDTVISIGTTSVFPYISGPVEHAIQEGIPTIEVNPSTTPLSHQVNIKVDAKAADWFAELAKSLA